MRTLAFLSLAALVAVPGLAAAKSYDFEAHDQYFVRAGQSEHNPPLTLQPGENVTINLVQKGVQPHNWMIDNVPGAKIPATTYVQTPEQNATGTFTAPQSGTLTYYCQIHPTTMKGTITIQSAGSSTDTDNDGGASAGDDKDTPGVGLVGLLAVLGAVAVAATRRRA